MDFLSLIGISFVSSIVWVVNVEAATVYYGSELGWHPLTVGLTAALGQNLSYILFYRGGAGLAQRWNWLGKKVDQTRRRFQKKLDSSYLWLTAAAALTGIPPAIAMVTLASGFNIPLRSVLLITYPIRAVRFTLFALLGGQIFA